MYHTLAQGTYPVNTNTGYGDAGNSHAFISDPSVPCTRHPPSVDGLSSSRSTCTGNTKSGPGSISRPCSVSVPYIQHIERPTSQSVFPSIPDSVREFIRRVIAHQHQHGVTEQSSAAPCDSTVHRSPRDTVMADTTAHHSQSITSDSNVCLSVGAQVLH